MGTTLEYDRLVERKLAEREAKGNVESKKLSEAEMAKEIADIQDGAVSSFAESEVQDRTVMEVQPIPPYVNSIMNKQQSATIPRKRGRPKGSRNRPKEAK